MAYAMFLLRLHTGICGSYEIPFVSRERPGHYAGAVASSGADGQVLGDSDPYKHGGWF
jgi:hypothetical protein